MIGLERDIVRLVAYNPDWERLYELEKDRLNCIVGEHILDIQHVGSTAIPGGVAKPIIDIAIAVESYEKAFVCIEPIIHLGYEYKGENGIPRRHYFVRRQYFVPQEPLSTHHIHINEQKSQEWWNQILFRDYLLSHPMLVAEYAALKKSLAEQFPSDRLAYTEGKAPFIEGVLRLARSNTSPA